MTTQTSAPAEQHDGWLRDVANNLTALTAIMVLVISNLALAAVGINYEGHGGAAWQKIHPASYAAILTLVVFAISYGNPVAFIDDIVRANKGTLVFVLMLFVLFAFIVVRIKGPVTQLIDSFLTPLILFVTLIRQRENRLRALALFLHLFMTANAILGLVEFATGFRLTPLVAEGVILVGDWRSTAFLGHPLLNAAAVTLYSMMLMTGGGRDLPMGLRIAQFVLQVVSMAAFGGRAATALFFVFAIPIGVAMAWRHRGNYRLSPGSAGAIVLIVAMVAVGFGMLISGGFFEKFISRFVQDDGSAIARQSMFDLLARLPPEMFWFGSDPEYISTLQRMEGIPFGIESFWIAIIANYGLLISIPFFASFLLLMNDFRRNLIPTTTISILLFLVLISGSTSLASKTAMLSFFTVAACLLLRKQTKNGTSTSASVI